ncbi:uncharacterized protein LOC131680228 [Topomyia yanbarensis]|uniref:uncharacterized protein LOC131680228 n=1 Tax=Topomyia yanbarensis TaxID=2498891 RepID=UPI00273BBDB7|nr:uncharacterized protein LOC131680228 [Topomyia yanbarensis]
MATKTEKKLSEYVIQRKGIFVVQKAVEKFAEDFDCDRDACQIPIRPDSLDRIYKEFLEVQGQIELYDKPEMLDSHLEERMDFETRYCRVKGFLLSNRAADPNQTMLNSTMAAPAHVSSSFHLRLPKIDLPKFNGDFSRWLAFRDTYTSMIHNNTDIPTVAKLQYLLQSLEEETRTPFESVDVEADNYASTWEALLKRYDNKRFLKRQLFRALYDLSPVSQESPQEIHVLADDFHRHVKALANWTQLRAWEEKTSNNDDVTYDMLIEFLYQRVRMLTSVITDLRYRSQQPVTAYVAGSIPTPKPFKVSYKAATVESSSSALPCLACPEKYFLFQCPAFSEMSICQRRELVSQKRLCWNCFRTGHQARNCTSVFSCRNCHEKHHSLLHEPVPSNMQPTPVLAASQSIPSTSAIAVPSSSVNAKGQVSLSVQAEHSTVLLETVCLLVVDQNGKEIPVRALLDSGSMFNLITNKLANSLNLRRTKVDIAVAGIGESTKQIKCQLTARIKSKSTPYSTKLEFLILKRPTVNLPTAPIDISEWNLPKLSLADPRFHIPSDIDMVVGGETYHELHPGSKRSLGEGLPLLIETVFGWTVSGKIAIDHPTVPRVCHLTTVDRSSEQALQKFQELEAVEPFSVYSVEEKQCKELYATTTTRGSFGRYLVHLPLTRDPLVNLGESRAIAERHCLSLEKRLERDSPTKDAYCNFMDEYVRISDMRKLLDPVEDVNPHCYLAHHPVFKEKTFRQIQLHFEDRALKRIPWCPNRDEPLAMYELQTATAKQVELDDGAKYPATVDVVKQEFHVGVVLLRAYTLGLIDLAITIADALFSTRLFSRSSSCTKLHHPIAYWPRYFRAQRPVSQQTKPELFDLHSTTDLRDYDLALCRVAQWKIFFRKFCKIRRRDPLPASLIWLKPKLYKYDVIRVSGILKPVVVSDDVKHPTLQLAKHPITEMLSELYHKQLLYAGPQLTLNTRHQKL